MIEAELKAQVRDPGQLRNRLGDLAVGESSTYRDTYYDWPGRQLSKGGGRELRLRLRLVVTASRQRSLLTYKDPAADSASGSKPEHETELADPTVIDVTLRALGLVPFVAFEKHCTNYRFAAQGRDVLATVVQVPELDGTFLEVETMATEDSMAAALADVRAVLRQLGIAEDDLTTEQYTEAVLKARE
ncbi:MAG: class IV adenylate cyclase [Streptosporangiales bacterium]